MTLAVARWAGVVRRDSAATPLICSCTAEPTGVAAPALAGNSPEKRSAEALRTLQGPRAELLGWPSSPAVGRSVWGRFQEWGR